MDEGGIMKKRITRSNIRSGPRSSPMHRAGIAWFDPDTYLEMVDLIGDPAILPFNYETWLERAEGRDRSIRRSGVLAVRVKVDPGRFKAWCAAQSVSPGIRPLYGFLAEACGTGLNPFAHLVV
jgi:hypothetical protein